ncbi:uncharacterized protein LOC131876280 [Cryptomeria japonica]|uniref:uncharacterized protein LOC131876280 n=1 Tax=Cryptomeria japonica TaxID=3369 RepID=UPI0027D9D039|nr:uncharacterized protein LOC131876280 [Cryptomeria japonica]
MTVEFVALFATCAVARISDLVEMILVFDDDEDDHLERPGRQGEVGEEADEGGGDLGGGDGGDGGGGDRDKRKSETPKNTPRKSKRSGSDFFEKSLTIDLEIQSSEEEDVKGTKQEKIESSSGERRLARIRAKERNQPTKTKTNLYEIYNIEDKADSQDDSEDEDVNVDEEKQTESPDENIDEEEEIEEENNKSESEQESPFKEHNSLVTSEDMEMVPCSPLRWDNEKYGLGHSFW